MYFVIIEIVWSILYKSIYYGYSLKSPHQDDSNEHPQHRFVLRNNKVYPLNYHEIHSSSVPVAIIVS